MTQEMMEAGPADAEVLSVFDFDGTLTHRDSFVPFLLFAFGKRAFAVRVLRMLPDCVRYVGKGLTRDELKAALIATFLTGVEEQWVQRKAAEFQRAFWKRLMRPAGVRSVAAEVESGAHVTICSASPRLVLTPFADKLGIKLIATELEVVDGRLTGAISGSNCRCENKVLRLEAVYGSLDQYRLRAWGDTRGDHELLAAAHEPHWRHFHPRWKRGRLKVERIVARLREGESLSNPVTGTLRSKGPHDQQPRH
ncbi:HAD family hydrolase [Pseudomonas cremoricolorata]|uniref:HAD family hydrolase n=1 Tax=Pseudomonas cremoricolorata TaxID=157783 RepID=UPI00041E3906|nr:HAD family hydrolase [Pseudomonas cremoricolorata]